jgi:hypothetical protein
VTDEFRAYSEAEALIELLYESLDGNPAVENFHERHEIDSLLILTVGNWYAAQAEVQKLIPDITGKTVVEIGAGVGMLALQMARYAKHVWAIEADPGWNMVFTRCLYALKPVNLTWIFGRAQELVGVLKADVAVVYTRSDIKGMGVVAAQMAPVLIRGPLVEYSERYSDFMTKEQLAWIEEHATTAMMESFNGRRGMKRQALLDLEQRFNDKFGRGIGVPND